MTLTPTTLRVPLTGMDAYLSIFGANGRNLALLEGELAVGLSQRGSELEIAGAPEDAELAARVVEKLGVEADDQNHLLMHAVGANVSGQIASVVAGGVILGFFL